MIRAIPNFKGYFVSDEGTIYSGRTGLRKLHLDRNGYLKISIKRAGENKSLLAHRAVCLAFIANPDNKSDVNHKNGIRTDNRVENLEWATRRENVIHGFTHNGRKIAGNKGEANTFHVLVDWQVLAIKLAFALNSDSPIKPLAAKYGVSYSSVYRIKNNMGWKHLK